MSRRSVVFPAPLGPISAARRPGWKVALTCLNTCAAGNTQKHQFENPVSSKDAPTTLQAMQIAPTFIPSLA